MRLLLWLIFGIVTRVFAPGPNFSPLISMAFLTGFYWSRIASLIIIFAVTIITDGILGWMHDYPVFGTWSLFTYSGIAIITLFGTCSYFFKKYKYSFMWNIIFTFGFWLWTNLGTWIFSGIYAHTWEDFINCYTFASPESL